MLGRSGVSQQRWGLMQVNPLVSSTLEAHAKLQQPLYLARQGCSRTGPANSLAGVSAFAFQGTNAHAVLAAADRATAVVASMPAANFWRRRMWYASTEPHRLLQVAAALAGAWPGRQMCISNGSD